MANIYNQTTNLQMKSGLIENIGNQIKWVVTGGDKGYTIRSFSNGNILLGVPENTSSASVQAESIVAPSYPDRFYWEITIGANGGCILKNVYNGKYLYTNGTNLYTSSTLGTAGTSTYYTRTWRLAGYMYYGNTDSYEKREFGSFGQIDTLPLKKEMSKEIQTQYVKDAEFNDVEFLWAEPADFVLSSSSENIVIDNQLHQITGIDFSQNQVVAYHKVTGQNKSFLAVVCDFEATVYNFYDKGFYVYNEITYGEGREYIEKYTYEASIKFAELFGLYINYGPAQYFESELDKCKGTVTTENINTIYECSNNDDAWEDISSFAPGSSTETSIYWTNHKLIWENEYGVERLSVQKIALCTVVD